MTPFRYPYTHKFTCFSILFSSENDEFKWPINLQELVLSFNGLDNQILSSLSDLPHLQSLDLSYNQLQGAIDISGQYFL